MLRLGRYEIEAEIAQGSMGVVYLAKDPRVRRQLALKTYLLPRGLSREEEREFSDRFLHEAEAAGALSHPGIVTVYDADEDKEQGIPFIAMEYVPGRSLRQLLADEGKLLPGRAFEIVATLADTLHAAHEAGIIHRDVKPANVLVREPDGVVKMADFGVARLPTSELTRSGLSFGSPAYMAPEHLRGSPVDRRSDLFSLAVIFYQTLCGQRPFGGADLMSVAYSVVNEVPEPISKRVPGLPPGLDRFFEKALAKNPDDRFQTGIEFRQELESVWRDAIARPAASDVVSQTAAQETSEAPVETPLRKIEELTSAPRGDSGVKAEPANARFDARAYGVAILILTVAVAGHALWIGKKAPDLAGAGAEAAGDAGTDSDRRVSMSSPQSGAGASSGGASKRTGQGTASLSKGKIEPRAGRPGNAAAAPPVARNAALKTDARAASRSAAQGADRSGLGAGRQPDRPGGAAAVAGGGREPQVGGATATPTQTVESAPAFTAPEPGPQSHAKGPMSVGEDAGADVEGDGAAPDGSQATIVLTVRSHVAAGTLRLLVDGRQVYVHRLAAVSKEGQGLLKRAFTKNSETLKARISVPAGMHDVVAVLAPGGASDVFRQKATVELRKGRSQKLKIVAGKDDAAPLTLDVD